MFVWWACVDILLDWTYYVTSSRLNTVLLFDIFLEFYDFCRGGWVSGWAGVCSCVCCVLCVVCVCVCLNMNISPPHTLYSYLDTRVLWLMCVRSAPRKDMQRRVLQWQSNFSSQILFNKRIFTRMS